MQGALAIAATWAAFTLAFVVETPADGVATSDLSDLIIGAILGAVLVVVGFAATSRVRPRPLRHRAKVAALAGFSVLIGILVGTMVAGELLLFAKLDPKVHAELARFVGEPAWRPVGRAVNASVIEEVTMRLAGMGVIAWTAMRWGKTQHAAFLIALVLTAIVFGLAHLHAISLVGFLRVAANAAVGVLYGWMFWKWGLPHAILAHLAGGLVHGTLVPRLL
ncbi:MAG: type II CAAX prenyl endopeptidase Rce1 family protein [Gemmatimonadaceae bacterium]